LRGKHQRQLGEDSAGLRGGENEMNLKQKFRLLVTVAVAGLVVMATLWVQGERSRLLEGKEEQMRSLVDLAYSAVQAQEERAQAGQQTEQQAQDNAREIVRGMRYGDKNYLWINDLRPVMVMHPFKPAMEGKDLSGFVDPKGTRIFVEFAKMAREKGDGTLYYWWPKPGQSEPVKKVSYVRQFRPWGWVIGTGTYIDDVNAAWRASALQSGGIALLCLAVLLAASVTISRSMVRRLERLAERIRDVAQGEGDLTQRIEIDAQDEIAAAAHWFNQFMDSLQEIMGRVAGNTTRLRTAAEEISVAAVRAADGSQQQTGQITQVATAMEEMSATVAEVSINANRVAEDARHAVEVAGQGGTIVQGALTRMESIAESVGATARRIEELGQRSDQIGKIVAVIEEIASQTNLLALNAAIEAARAGEHGRGFAVVAGEVRNLAERTTQATREIAGTIEAVQQETATAVEQMEAGTRLVELGVAETSKAGSALTEIITSSQHVGDMIAQIATTATQQTTAVGEINTSVAHIARIAQHGEEAARQSASTCEDLTGLAEDLRQTVGRFKLENGRTGGAAAA
jgi:methyl-accepting chemotaxis protein